MLSNNISVIIPVVRPESAARCIESVKKHLPGAEIVSRVDTDMIGCPKTVNALTRETTREWVMFLGDDTELTEGFEQALELAADAIGWGVVGLNTKPGNPKAHWMAHKKMLELLPEGVFFPECYHHCYCDDELYDFATENNRWVYAKDAIVEHHHPINGGKTDEFHMIAYPGGQSVEDRKTYVTRKYNRLGKVAIGFPLVDPTIPVQFFTSFACMEKPKEYTLLMPQFAHGPWTGSIADARNSIVAQAQMDGAKYLLMLDTDQIYAPETLTKLMANKKDICGVRVHRRWVPFDPIFYRGELGKYSNVPDEEAFSGGVIEVDATGTGCLLFDMRVFDMLPFPWFEFSQNDGKPVGEDIFFCHKARQAGIKIHVDTGIEVGHMTTVEVNQHLYKICKPMVRTM
jgi:hypothetical protein